MVVSKAYLYKWQCRGESSAWASIITLLSKAYKEYVESVLSRTKCYIRYVEDFAASLIVALDIDAPPNKTLITLSLTLANIQKALSMLYSRKDLVEHFFSSHAGTEPDFEEMLRYYNLDMPLRPKPHGKFSISAELMEKLAEIANDFGLFKEEVTADDLRGFLTGTGEPLHIREVNQMLGDFLGPLNDKNLLYSNWAQLIGNGRLAIGTKGNPISAKNLPKLVMRGGSSRKHERLYLAVLNLLK